MRRPVRKKNTIKRPAIIFRNKPPMLPKAPTIDSIEKTEVENRSVKYGPVKYEAGKVIWRGVEYSRKDIQDLIQALERTPVSQGRFPTEGDFIIDAYLSGGALGVRKEDVYEQAKSWKSNYLIALDQLREGENFGSLTEEIYDIYDELYWKISGMGIDTFIFAMSKYNSELSIAFKYTIAAELGAAKRLQELWEEF